ncbi:MAG: hypothetical protein ACI9JY_002901, partial [Saprospiraceae bacterium]
QFLEYQDLSGIFLDATLYSLLILKVNFVEYLALNH